MVDIGPSFVDFRPALADVGRRFPNLGTDAHPAEFDRVGPTSAEIDRHAAKIGARLTAVGPIWATFSLHSKDLHCPRPGTVNEQRNIECPRAERLRASAAEQPRRHQPACEVDVVTASLRLAAASPRRRVASPPQSRPGWIAAEATISQYEGEQAAEEKTVVDKTGERATETTALEGTMKQIESLKPGCDFLLINYEARVQKRQLDMDGLQKAKAILQGGRSGCVCGSAPGVLYTEGRRSRAWPAPGVLRGGGCLGISIGNGPGGIWAKTVASGLLWRPS